LTKPLKTPDNLNVAIYSQRNDTLNMTHVPITLKNNSKFAKHLEPIKVSIPFKNGEIFNINTLELVNDEQQINKQLTVLTYWPNMSVKWIQVDFLFSSNAKSETTVLLKNSELKITEPSSSGVKVQESANHIAIETKSSIFQLSKTQLGSFTEQPKTCRSETKTQFKSTENTLVLTDKNGIEHQPIIEKITFSSNITVPQPIKLTFFITGSFKNQNLTRFEAEITFYYQSNITKWRLSVHNPKAMQSNNGTWDLGNENSSFFKSFCVFIPCENKASLAYKIHDEYLSPFQNELPWHVVDKELSIFQASSGGKNWQSDNHVNYQGKNCIEFNGYKISSFIGQNINSDIIEGRATPTVHVSQSNKNTESTISVYIENFWQKFPKSLEVEPNKITLGLFPEQAKGGFELQPGEKNQMFFILITTAIETVYVL